MSVVPKNTLSVCVIDSPLSLVNIIVLRYLIVNRIWMMTKQLTPLQVKRQTIGKCSEISVSNILSSLYWCLKVCSEDDWQHVTYERIAANIFILFLQFLNILNLNIPPKKYQ